MQRFAFIWVQPTFMVGGSPPEWAHGNESQPFQVAQKSEINARTIEEKCKGNTKGQNFDKKDLNFQLWQELFTLWSTIFDPSTAASICAKFDRLCNRSDLIHYFIHKLFHPRFWNHKIYFEFSNSLKKRCHLLGPTFRTNYCISKLIRFW